MSQPSSSLENAKKAIGHRLFPFMKYRHFFMVLSTILFIACLGIIFKKGFNFGVDFLGGVRLVYQFSQPTGDDQIREVLAKTGLSDAQVVRFGKAEDNSFLIRVRAESELGQQAVLTAQLNKDMAPNQAKLLSEEMVGPKVGADLRQRGLFAVISSLVLILLYIGWRFDFLFSTGAIVALAHDTVFALGLYTYLDKEVNLPILAAILTLIGYSNNDTIIIYDRIRENLKKLPSQVSLLQIIDLSLNETLSRSIITHLTVFFSVGILYFFGGGVIHDFAFLMIIGVVVGSYSSIFIAAPIYIWMQRIFPHQGLLKGTKKAIS